jgi:hypothetical protein
MNAKFKMPNFGRDLTLKGWFKEVLMTFLGTTISIVLTFGTAAWLDHRQQVKNRRQTAMMVIANIEDFAENMRYVDSALVAWDSTLIRITSLPRDSVLRLNEDEVRAFFTAIGGGVLLQRDNTAENIFTNDISTWRDVGNLQFIRNVGECYSFINDIEKNYRIQLDRKNELNRRFVEDYYKDGMTPGECVATMLDMKGTNYFIADFTGSFINYFERSIDDLLRFNRANMQLIGVTHEEVMDFIKAGEQTTE